MNYVLVYQNDFANVFHVATMNRLASKRGLTMLVMDGPYTPAEWFCRGLVEAGAAVRVAHCDMYGDIGNKDWEPGEGSSRGVNKETGGLQHIGV